MAARARQRLATGEQGEAFDWARVAPPPPLSTLDTPTCPEGDDDLAALLGLSHDELARLAQLRGRLADERGRRLDAIDGLMTSPNLTEVEKVVAYGVVKAGAVAQERQPEDTPTRELVINQTTIACDIGVSRQTIGKTLKRWTGQGYMREEARGTGRFTKKGKEIRETVIQLPGRTLTDNLVMASAWERAPDAPKQGGNGKRSCPLCDGTEYKKTTRDVMVRTTRVVCATLGCNHVYEVVTKEITKAKTFIHPPGDWATDIPTMLDLTKLRRPVSTVDTPPCPEVDYSPPVEDVVNLGTPPPTWGPVSCTDCYAEGRAPAGETWTCLRCQRKRRGEVAPYDRQAGD